jgi:hypothetical protein
VCAFQVSGGNNQPKRKVKTIKIIPKIIMAGALVLALTTNVFAQTNLHFIGVSQTDEQAIRLTWTSTNHEVYQIQCADALATNADGSTAWQILYDNYPSQGTNTFWLDTGDYLLHVPPIVHPKYSPMRFYRIVDKEADTITDETVSIVSPANGTLASNELTVTVVASTNHASLSTKLYVDGQEMWPTKDGSNYVINTCEWGNGSHILFATAECLSAPAGGPLGSPAVSVGHAVSPFVPVTFSNLVTRISFSQTSFQPSLGQTQQVSAIFAANVNWALQIRDNYSNLVRTATGSGTSMLFHWDGQGDGGTNIPAGVYYYYISAQTNGQSFSSSSMMSSESFLSSSSELTLDDSLELWAMPADGSGAAVPFAIYPPGFNTNDLLIFEASRSDMQPQRMSSRTAESIDYMDSSNSYSGQSSQNAPPAPLKPPTTPTLNSAGTFGIAFQTYSANGAGGYQPAMLKDNSIGLNSFVKIEGHGTADPPIYHQLRNADTEAINFGVEMSKGGWSPELTKPEDKLQISDLRGSGNPFNQVDIGYLGLHCAYGTTTDSTPGASVKQMYFPIAAGTGSQYLRMSEMNFGGPTRTNGLKWMVLDACTSLYHVNWSSMQSQNVKPYNSNLHLLLGVDTDDSVEPLIGQYFADYMLGDPSLPRAPMTIHDAWYAAARQAYADGSWNGTSYQVNPMIYAIAGDSACFSDYLQTKTNTVLSGSWTRDTSQVYP